jgi:hypothetical protein
MRLLSSTEPSELRCLKNQSVNSGGRSAIGSPLGPPSRAVSEESPGLKPFWVWCCFGGLKAAASTGSSAVADDFDKHSGDGPLVVVELASLTADPSLRSLRRPPFRMTFVPYMTGWDGQTPLKPTASLNGPPRAVILEYRRSPLSCISYWYTYEARGESLRAMEDSSTSVRQNHLSALTKRFARAKCASSTMPAISSASWPLSRR